MQDDNSISIADRNEILSYLTSVMRNDDASIKERLTASVQLGKYIGLEDSRISGLPKVVIYDGYNDNKV